MKHLLHSNEKINYLKLQFLKSNLIKKNYVCVCFVFVREESMQLSRKLYVQMFTESHVVWEPTQSSEREIFNWKLSVITNYHFWRVNCITKTVKLQTLKCLFLISNELIFKHCYSSFQGIRGCCIRIAEDTFTFHPIFQIQSNSVITNSSGPGEFVRYNRGSL